MKISPARLRVLVALAVLLAVRSVPAVEAPPKQLVGLSKEQIQALPDNQPVLINGKAWTRTQLKLELEKSRARVRADLQGQVQQKLRGFELMKARHGSAQVEKARTLKASALAEAGRLAGSILVETPKPTPAPPPDPKLTSVGAAYIMPGSGFMVGGQALGAQAGTARLEGQFPGGHVNLIVEIWKNNFAVLTVPEGVSGVLRQTARVALKRTDGKATNTLPVLFEPLTDMKVLPSSDLIVVCSMGADINDCEALPNQTFEGTHANTIDLSSDKGTDKFKANLKNGWAVESHDFVTGGFSFSLGTGYAAQVHGITPGASTFDITVNFDVNPATNLEYYGLVYIRGPVGTSHK